MPSAPDLITPLRQNQQAMAQELKDQAAMNKLDFERRSQILKANRVIEELGAKDLLAITEGGKKLLDAGVEVYGQFQEDQAAAFFMQDVEAQEAAKAEYQLQQQELSLLDNEAEKVALQAARENAPFETVSRYNQLWGRGKREYERQAAEFYGSEENVSAYFAQKLQSDETIELEDGTPIQLNNPRNNAEAAAVREYLVDSYVQENGLQAMINNNPGLMADKFMPGLMRAKRKLAAEYEKVSADNQSFETQTVELNSLVSNAKTDPLALSHYLNIISNTTKDGKRLGMRGAWNLLETSLVELQNSGKDIIGVVEVLKTRTMPNDPKQRTYGEMHGTKLDLIVDKALDEDRKNYRQEDELNRIKLEEDRAELLRNLPENASKQDILNARDAFTARAQSYDIYDANMQVFDRMLMNPAINGDLAREQAIESHLEGLSRQHLLTVDEVEKFPGIKNYARYFQAAQQQEKDYNTTGGLKDALDSVEADIKKDRRVQLYGKVGELGGTAMMATSHYKRLLSERYAQLMMTPGMDAVTAAKQAFQEFQLDWKEDTSTPGNEFYFTNNPTGGQVGFLDFGKNAEANRRAFSAKLAKIVNKAQKEPETYLKEKDLFGNEQFWTKAMRGFGTPGFRFDPNLVRLSRQLGVSVLDIYKNQVQNYPQIDQPPSFNMLLKQDPRESSEYKRFLENYARGTATNAQFHRFAGRPPVRPLFSSYDDKDRSARLTNAIIGQESGNNHNAVNGRTNALGLVQVMPENVGPFTERYLGRAMSYAEFKSNRAAQELLARRLVEDLLARHDSPGRSEEEIIRRAAAEHYGGPGAVEYWNSSAYHAKGSRFNPYGNEPDMAEYTMSVYQRYLRGR